ncbi:endoplasmic reticulum lectin 1 isoform X2 [Phymastichus coffea]|uniref:endoplasmic reticulum lectin 1 isoform X2 n=1 Tax=Phymastichus coffea TaxID=108790 RepID=UPI00273BFC81|nr:endoplasmic reticulum lectin 1 isoform X2 [Phymastichus coffea]
MHWTYIYHVFFIINIFVSTFGYDLKAFDDTVLFKINWPGKTVSDLLDTQANAESYTITSANNEKYHCFIPEVSENELKPNMVYTGPNPIEYLSVLFDQNACSYRIESYWTYELCHGRYVQQYHEERDGKKVKVQKYELGKFDAFQVKKLIGEYNEYSKNPNRKSEIPLKKIDGVNMPYVEIEMSDGTMCDINNKPRSIKVLYVCYQHGKQEIYSVKETATCEYETIVLTPLLCNHPDYKPQDTGEHKINCRPIDDAPKKPLSLMVMESESLKLRQQKVMDGQPQLRVEVHPIDSNGKQFTLDDVLNPSTEEGNELAKSNSIRNFLSGQNCLNGGNGWWKYEFCYGRTVSQYHIESGGNKKVLSLGVFNKQKHIEWIEVNTNKKPKPIGKRKQVSHFYSDGSICDLTGKPRQTEVKLKCVTNPMGSQSSVSLYLLEPTSCEYVLGVESPLICEILEHADDTYGLISEKALMNFDESKSNLQVHNNMEEDNERIANEDE